MKLKNKISSISPCNQRFISSLLALISFTCLLYSFRFILNSPCVLINNSHNHNGNDPGRHVPVIEIRDVARPNMTLDNRTTLDHIVFGIAASSKFWPGRKEYVKTWWRPGRMRGVVWLDGPVKNTTAENTLLPPMRFSGNTSSFEYRNRKGHRSAIRISRIISETFRSTNATDGVRWFVMGDDDTVFVPDNLLRVLRRYNHEGFWYIGSNSESHVQNMEFSYNMAYGGGGFAVSYGLAKAVERMQDACIRRYPGLYGSDDRIQACMAELGVPLTRDLGFHQFDIYGNAFGLLAAHPVTPLVSLHHLDLIEPIFPNMTRVPALRQLWVPQGYDSAALMQQSICYDPSRSWTVSVSWGYAVQLFRGIHPPREMELPGRTFLDWYKKSDNKGFSFNTRHVTRHACYKPYVYFLSDVQRKSGNDTTVSQYVRHWEPDQPCKWKMADPSRVERVVVHKKPDPNMWDKAPRRNCCRVVRTNAKNTLEVNVGECGEDEIIAARVTVSLTETGT
ncbi:hypothetical protein MLD38_018269 [Melastoma candidum]|uniref:Uncharacterized protein n=1 Tax=Melastoma candidum TaxID=119954 RepID=A0ACB9QSF3_9MYRT|nr:hypothetical protein MLD38_018269 [Melastoma candidum]